MTSVESLDLTTGLAIALPRMTRSCLTFSSQSRSFSVEMQSSRLYASTVLRTSPGTFATSFNSRAHSKWRKLSRASARGVARSKA